MRQTDLVFLIARAKWNTFCPAALFQSVVIQCFSLQTHTGNNYGILSVFTGNFKTRIDLWCIMLPNPHPWIRVIVVLLAKKG